MKVLVHYHEIALKGKNRAFFVDRLAQNLRQATADLPGTHVHVLQGRLQVEAPDEVPWERLRERIAAVFGIANFARAIETPADLEALKASAVEALRGHRFGSFRVATKRAYKPFPKTSMEIDRELGGALKAATG